jgi:hypothetical protein
MKTKAFALLVMMVVLAAGVASAQSTEPVNFRTPFAFVVGDRLMPAGEYTVQVLPVTAVLSFRSRADGNLNVFVNSIPMQKAETESRFRLVFHRYGSHYYVSEIWTPGYRTGRTMLQQPSELRLAKSTTQQHVTLYADARTF